MSLASVKEMLQHATKHQYGIPAMNVFNYESIKWAIQAAEEEQKPIIIQFYPGYTVHISMNVIAQCVIDLAQKATVPIGLHLDHARDFDTAVEGIKAGFRSVMIDGSQYPFEENVALTAAVARVARVFGVDVEAELGHVGSGGKVDDFTNPNHFTDPHEVQRFIEQTRADTLAISIGNGHGNYVQTPVLDFERISTIRRLTSIPLVMHGGTGIPMNQMQEAVRRGMSKFNIATEYGIALYRSMTPIVDKCDSYYGVLHSLEEGAVNYIRSKIRLLNPE